MDRDNVQSESSRSREPGPGREVDSQAASERHDLKRILVVADERTRRLLVGFLAREYGRGGIAHFARITGLSRETIRRGQRELQQPVSANPGRVRRPGAGRKRIEIKFPGSCGP